MKELERMNENLMTVLTFTKIIDLPTFWLEEKKSL